jgi:hypothetical protein
VIFVSIFEKYFIMVNFNELAEKPTIVEVEKSIPSPGPIFGLHNLLNPFTIATENIPSSGNNATTIFALRNKRPLTYAINKQLGFCLQHKIGYVPISASTPPSK